MLLLKYMFILGWACLDRIKPMFVGYDEKQKTCILVSYQDDVVIIAA